MTAPIRPHAGRATSDRIAPPPSLKTGVSRLALAGGLAGIGLLVAAVLWAQFTQIGGAVIASGQVVVRGLPKNVQSLDGGVVEAIRVENGSVVKAGDVLMRLDPTVLRVNLDIYRNRLAEALARKARLEAEHLGRTDPVFPPAPAWLGGLDPALQEEGQRQIFTARAEVLSGRKEQLAEKIVQFHNQITGVEGQITALKDQLGYIEKDLGNVRSLNERGLAREGEVLDRQRSQSALLGQIAEQQATLARIANSIRDTELEIVQGEREFKEQVVTDLREATATAEELVLQIVTTEKQLERIDLRAPVDGVVHELQMTTVGGVVQPGGNVMQIVPLAEGVEYEVRVEPRAIDRIFIGQRAKVVLPAFASRTLPDIYGEVSSISPTSVTDPATGQSFYRTHLRIPPEEMARLGPVQLVPGMPVEAFLETGERSVMDYLTKPLADQLSRAFREG